MTYLEKLKNPRWQKMRLKILERDDWTCQACGNKEMTLNIHHRYYKAKTDPWDYPEESLLTLCEECHEIERIAYPEASAELMEACKEKLLSGDVQSLAIGIHFAPSIKEKSIDAIAWALENPKELTHLIKKYKSHRKKQMEEIRNKRSRK